MEAEAAVIGEREGGALKATGTFSGRGSVGADDGDEGVTDEGVVEQGRAGGGGRGGELEPVGWDGVGAVSEEEEFALCGISNLLGIVHLNTQDR